jgi:hypothetical protein
MGLKRDRVNDRSEKVPAGTIQRWLRAEVTMGSWTNAKSQTHPGQDDETDPRSSACAKPAEKHEWSKKSVLTNGKVSNRTINALMHYGSHGCVSRQG